MSEEEQQSETRILIGNPHESIEELRQRARREEKKKPILVKLEEQQEKRLIGGISGALREVLGEQTQEFLKQLEKNFNAIREDISGPKGFLSLFQESFKKLPKEPGEVPGELGLRLAEAIENLNKAMNLYAQQQRISNELLEAQTPESLRIPTPESLIERRIKKEVKSLQQRGLSEEEIKKQLEAITVENIYGPDPYRNVNYQRDVKDWFEQRLRLMETSELAFEEQPEVYQRLMIALTFFEFRDETRFLAGEIRKRVEARRLAKLMVRSWNLSTPDNLGGIASRFNMGVIREIFTHKEGEDAPVAREFQEYEKLGVELQRKREELKTQIEDLKSQESEKRAAGQEEYADSLKSRIQELQDEFNGREIKDYYEHGGKITQDGEEVFVDEAIKKLEEKGSREGLNDQEEATLKNLRDIFWARRTAGALWSITFRAAHFDVVLNGTGDFFATRIMHFAKRLEDAEGFATKTKGIWMPEKGKYAGQPLDLGLRDFFTSVIVKTTDTWRNEKGVVMDNEGKIVTDLSGAQIGEEEFWKGLERAGVSDTAYHDHIDRFENADETRKFFWGPDSFFDDPDIQKFLEMKKYFKHIPEKNRPEKWYELTERYLEWMAHDPRAPEVQEELQVVKAAQMAILIEEASERELLSNKARDELLRKYLFFPLPISPRGMAEARVFFDTMLGILWRYPPSRNQIAFGWFWELIKQAFKYTFS